MTTWTSLRRPLAKVGRSGRSISRQVRIASSDGRPSRRKNEPGMRPAAYIRSSTSTVSGKKSNCSFGLLAGRGGRQQHGVAQVDDDGAGGLPGQPAGLEGDRCGCRRLPLSMTAVRWMSCSASTSWSRSWCGLVSAPSSSSATPRRGAAPACSGGRSSIEALGMAARRCRGARGPLPRTGRSTGASGGVAGGPRAAGAARGGDRPGVPERSPRSCYRRRPSRSISER